MGSSRRGDRERRERKLERSQVHQLSRGPLRRFHQPLEILSPEGLEAIHATSLTILEEIGMDFLHPQALEILSGAGAKVNFSGSRVRFDRGLVEHALSSLPSHFRLCARDPRNDVVIGLDNMAFASVSGPPNVSDLARGRRQGNHADFRDLVRLLQSMDVVHLFGGYPVEPVDLPVETRHLDCLADLARLSSKPFHAYSLGRTRILDAIEICRIVHGLSKEAFAHGCYLFTIVNTSSPLRLDGNMIEGMIEMARCNQPVGITPFTLAGAMSPVTIAGAIAQQNAEVLASIVLLQAIRPGCPVIYGGFTSNVDMKSGAPAFGTPEYAQAALATGQLARKYGIPFRSSNATVAPALNAQAAYESMMSLWSAMLGGANLVMHAAGWLESGLCASFEKVILDCEMLQLLAAFQRPFAVDPSSMGLEAIREVGPGGHFFGTAQTLELYSSAFYQPLLSDWRSFGAWSEAGAPTLEGRAHDLMKEILRQYEEPKLDPAVSEELSGFVEQRKREGGALQS
jgi:trimethylamine---corrinoid protein Co-methyltransferase